jgi:MoaA/NifB/PqqE/SkfB family radical SAM enzyme
MESIEKILQEAKSIGFKDLSFTGGEPTLHPGFQQILSKACGAGYRFGFVSNGWNFTDVYEQVLNLREHLNGVTFSLDGAEEQTHDRMRGEGSFRRLMSAVSICVAKDIPFTLNALITSNNCHELTGIIDMAVKLGSGGLRFGHLIPAKSFVLKRLVLTPEEKDAADKTVLKSGKNREIPVYLAPGYYTENLFPCDPLQMKEINVDWLGNVTMCCHLSGYGDRSETADIIGNLDDISFSEANKRLKLLNRKFRQNKLAHFAGKEIKNADFFPCMYCLQYFNKKDG